MKQNWKPLLILALLATAVVYLYPTVEFYGMAPSERETLEHDAPTSYYDM